jgi:hypothetical protein
MIRGLSGTPSRPISNSRWKIRSSRHDQAPGVPVAQAPPAQGRYPGVVAIIRLAPGSIASAHSDRGVSEQGGLRTLDLLSAPAFH